MWLDHWILSLDLDLDLLRLADNRIDSMSITPTCIFVFLFILYFFYYICETWFGFFTSSCRFAALLENLGWPIYGHRQFHYTETKLNLIYYIIISNVFSAFLFITIKKLQVLLVFFYNFVQQRSATGFEQHLVLICKTTATD